MRAFSILALCVVTLAPGACVDRLTSIGHPPDISPVGNPAEQEEQRIVSVPIALPDEPARGPNSTWIVGKKSFFRDQRARQLGDILTVLIEIQDQAKIENETTRTRANNEDLDLSGFFGLPSKLDEILPETFDPADAVALESGSGSAGTGSIDRSEDISLRVAAIVTGVLPNGNFVIAGRQEIRVNFELRELRIAGIIRPEDISTFNTVDYDQIAEARISYGGRGQITDAQQPRYGQQLLDIVLPF